MDPTSADAVDAVDRSASASCSQLLLASVQPMSGSSKIPQERLAPAPGGMTSVHQSRTDRFRGRAFLPNAKKNSARTFPSRRQHSSRWKPVPLGAGTEIKSVYLTGLIASLTFATTESGRGA